MVSVPVLSSDLMARTATWPWPGAAGENSSIWTVLPAGKTTRLAIGRSYEQMVHRTTVPQFAAAQFSLPGFCSKQELSVNPSPCVKENRGELDILSLSRLFVTEERAYSPPPRAWRQPAPCRFPNAFSGNG